MNLEVHTDFRRQGIGGQMLAKLMSKLSTKREFYGDTGEDAYHFGYEIEVPVLEGS